MDENFYTTYEAAKMCHVTPASVVRWIHEGKIQSSSTAGGHHRIHPEEIVSLLHSLHMPIPDELAGHHRAKRVLIVDDEASVRRFLRTLLQAHFPDVGIEEAEDGFAAGAALTRLLPDLILLDIKIPGLDGFRVCEFIRKNPKLNHAKIVIITGVQDPEVEGRVLKLGADDFLAKPFEAATLKQKIETQLGLLKERR